MSTETVIAIDVAGNISSPSPGLRVTILSTPPAAPSKPVLPAAEDSGTVGDGITNVNQPFLTGTAAANVVVKLVSNGVTIGTGSSGSGGTYSIAPSSILADGSYVITAIATDLAANVSVPSLSLALTILATIPPAPTNIKLLSSDDSGVPGDGITNVNLPHLTGTAEANATVELIGPGGAIIGTTVAGSGGTFSVQPNARLADGTYSLLFRAVDVAGNVSPPNAPFALTIKTTAPSASSAQRSMPRMTPGAPA